MKRRHWMAPHLGGDSQDPSTDPEDRWPVERGDPYNLIGSNVERGDLHMPVLDIDHRCHLYESETPGHFHLYIDKLVEWDKYVTLLKALAACGIIETGYANASINRGATFVAPRPWKEAARERTQAGGG